MNDLTLRVAARYALASGVVLVKSKVKGNYRTVDGAYWFRPMETHNNNTRPERYDVIRMSDRVTVAEGMTLATAKRRFEAYLKDVETGSPLQKLPYDRG